MRNALDPKNLEVNQFYFETDHIESNTEVCTCIIVTFDYRTGDILKLQDDTTNQLYRADQIPLKLWQEIELFVASKMQ